MKLPFLKLVALVVLVGLTATAVIARAHRRAANPALRREVAAYLKANVLPVLRQQRQKLEPQLAPADQAQLAAFRTQLSDIRQRAQALRQASPTQGSSLPEGTALVSLPQSPEWQRLRAERQGIMRQVAQLARKYAAPMTQIASEIEPQKARWTTDIQAIIAKNSTPEQQAQLAGFRQRAGQYGGLRKLLKGAMFLLMEPGAPASATPGTSLYPNPVAATTQLQYEVKKAGPVTVELLDKNGASLRSVVQAATQGVGSYTQAIDLSDLPSGTYYYKVTTRAGTETKRFVNE